MVIFWLIFKPKLVLFQWLYFSFAQHFGQSIARCNCNECGANYLASNILMTTDEMRKYLLTRLGSYWTATFQGIGSVPQKRNIGACLKCDGQMKPRIFKVSWVTVHIRWYDAVISGTCDKRQKQNFSACSVDSTV